MVEGRGVRFMIVVLQSKKAGMSNVIIKCG